MARYGCERDNNGDGDCDRHPRGCYRAVVSEEMVRVYRITWNDACGDEEPLVRAENDGDSPTEFVKWWGDRYELTPKKDW